MGAHRWTEDEDWLLKKTYREAAPESLAAVLGVTVCALRCRARKLGLARVPRWTARELRILRAGYGARPTREVARALRRPTSTVHRQAAKLGLCFQERHELTAPRERRLRVLVRQGWCNRHVGRDLGANRQTVRHWRRRLGLPPAASLGMSKDCPRCQEAVRANTRRQLEVAGVPTLGQLRAKVHRDRARAAGWPEDLRPRAVQILDLLWGHGPQTRREIAAALGMPWRGTRHSLTSNDPEGSYLAHLQARGLVLRLGRRYTAGYHYETIYSLSLFATKETEHAERT